jgi:hypothetical protein
VIDEPLAEKERPQPSAAAEIRRSIGDDGLVSFEDGRRYKTLKRHLTTRGLTPDAYRQKWGLPSDYPMVGADSSGRRSALAKLNGLGQNYPLAFARPCPARGWPNARPTLTLRRRLRCASDDASLLMASSEARLASCPGLARFN